MAFVNDKNFCKICKHNNSTKCKSCFWNINFEPSLDDPIYYRLPFGMASFGEEYAVFKLSDMTVIPKLIKKYDLYHCYMSHGNYVKINALNPKVLEINNDIEGTNIPDNMLVFLSIVKYQDIIEKGIKELI